MNPDGPTQQHYNANICVKVKSKNSKQKINSVYENCNFMKDQNTENSFLGECYVFQICGF